MTNSGSKSSPKEAEWCVVFDTSVLNEDPRLRSGGLQHLLRACKVASVRTWVPSVVVAELSAHYGPNMSKSNGKAKKSLEDLKRYDYAGQLDGTEIELESLARGYGEWLSKRLSAVGIGVLEHPKTSHESMVTRAVTSRRPFTKGDSGYKDALVWESVKALVLGPQYSVLLTTKDSDFALGDGLHPDLVSEIPEQGSDGPRVVLCRSFDRAVSLLDEMFGVIAELRHLDEAESQTAEQLEAWVPIDDMLRDEGSAIRSALSGYSETEFNGTGAISSSLTKATYAGDGVWSIEGRAEIEELVEYYDDFDRERREEDMLLEVEFTAYFNHRTGEFEDVDFSYVERIG